MLGKLAIRFHKFAVSTVEFLIDRVAIACPTVVIYGHLVFVRRMENPVYSRMYLLRKFRV